MIIRFGLVALFLAAAPAAAEECSAWTAGLEEDEGGKVMVARICQPLGNAAHELSVQCGEPGAFWIRLLPVAPDNYPPGGDYNFNSRFKFNFDKIAVEQDMVYQGMDGAMAGKAAFESPLAELLRSSRSMTMEDLSGKVPSATFILTGSKSAINKVQASCLN